MRDVKTGIQWLTAKGLNLFACFDCAQLPASILDVITRNGFDVKQFPRLILLGHGGRRLWAEIGRTDGLANNPFDEISVALTQQFLHDYLGQSAGTLHLPNNGYFFTPATIGHVSWLASSIPAGYWD